MRMSCISEFAKYIIFVFNFLIGCCALALVTFGIIYFLYEEKTFNVFSNIGNVFSLGILAIVIGVILFFVAGFGCCGAVYGNTRLLAIYAALLIILFVLQLTFGILALLKVINKGDFYHYVKTALQDIYDKAREDAASRKNFYGIQSLFTCCGVRGPGDYNPISSSYPVSCCEKATPPCTRPVDVGCADACTDTIGQYIEVIAYVCVVFAAIEILGAIFAMLVRHEYMPNKLRYRESTNTSEASSI